MIFVNQLPLWQRLILATLVGLFSTAVLFGVYTIPILIEKFRVYRSQLSGI